MKTGSNSLLTILTSEILQSAPNDAQWNSKNPSWKAPYVCRPASPKFSSILLYDQDISHFIFPLTPSATKISLFFFFADRQKIYNFIFSYAVTALFIVKFDLDRIKTVGE